MNKKILLFTVLFVFLFSACVTVENTNVDEKADTATENIQTYKDAVLDYNLAVMKGDTPPEKLAELKKALFEAILREIPNTGFYELWNMEHEIIDKWCKGEEKAFTDEEYTS